MKLALTWMLLWMLPCGLFAQGGFEKFNEPGDFQRRSPKISLPASARNEGLSQSPIRLPEKYSLVVPDGKSDGEARNFLFETPADAVSTISLPGNIVCSQIETTDANRKSLRKRPARATPAPMVGGLECLVGRCLYRRPPENALTPSRPQLLTIDGSWSPLVRWDDPTRVATLSLQDGAVTISIPGNKQYLPWWPQPTAPSLRTIPAFSGSLTGNWTLEAKIRVDVGSSAHHGKNCGAVGVSFPEGRSILAMQENGINGRLVSLNYPNDNNRSILSQAAFLIFA